jgi:uncharacterized protein with HEPN domain
MMEAAQKAIRFTRGKSRKDLDAEEQLTLSLVRLVEIIGEAASRISRDFQNQTPSILWPDIISTRNRLIHAYFDVNLDLLWETIGDNLPPLITELQKIIDEAEQQQKLF